MTARAWASLLILAACMSACGGKSAATSPTTPSTSTGQGGSCRTYPTLYSTVTTAPGLVQNAAITGRFDVATNQFTSDAVVTQSTGCTASARTVSTWASFNDFVSELSVSPPLEHRTRFAISKVLCDGSGETATGTLSYDNQQRLTVWTVQTAGASPSTIQNTITAWDGAGRPTSTTVTLTLASGTSSFTISSVFDDKARTETRTSIYPGIAPVVEVWTYDPLGFVSGVVGASNMTSAVASTTQVCR